nr:RNA-dependent RNA polymerase 1-like [Ipomoea batatas]
MNPETTIALPGKGCRCKNPCLHPGDVRVLRAVNVPAFEPYDLIPNECSGSDLEWRYLLCVGGQRTDTKTFPNTFGTGVILLRDTLRINWEAGQGEYSGFLFQKRRSPEETVLQRSRGLYSSIKNWVAVYCLQRWRLQESYDPDIGGSDVFYSNVPIQLDEAEFRLISAKTE